MGEAGSSLRALYRRRNRSYRHDEYMPCSEAYGAVSYEALLQSGTRVIAIGVATCATPCRQA